MSHIHAVIDSDTNFKINPITRQVKNESSRKTTLIQYDHNSERFTFEIPRYVEFHDMALCNKAKIHYINIDQKTKEEKRGTYAVDDLRVKEDDSAAVVCSWLISNNATQYAGRLSFIVRYSCVENGKTVYAWNSAPASVDVSSGIDSGDYVVTEYADVLERWKAELFNAGYINASTMQTEINVLSARMDNFARLPNGSTTGDAELQDIRIGANGETYETAGEAVRAQIHKLNAFAMSSIGAGIAEIADVYIKGETSTNDEECTAEGATPSQAYGNGVVFDREVQITGVRLHEKNTATKFSTFVFDEANTLIERVENISPTVTESMFDFEKPLTVPSGGYILIRFLDGVFFYKNTGSATFKEYQPGTGKLIDSPIKIGIDFIYNDIYQTAEFKDEPIIPSVQLKNYCIPRFVASEERFTYFGRWFDRVIGEKTYKAANAAGSSIAFKITGATKLNVGIYPLSTPNYTPYFAYSIDGGEFVRQKISDTTIPIPNTGDHWIWLVVDGMGENDPIAGGKWYGSVGVYFKDVTTDGVVCGATATNRQIMFVGDSIVEGINVLAAGANADTNSATNGFAFKAARLLNAIPLLCGYGGTAVLGNSSFHKPIEAIDYNMNDVPVNEQSPDIICVEHGYNDGTLVSMGAYTADDFKIAYNALLDRIVTKYPGKPILCLVPFAQSLKKEIRECAEKRPYCYVIETDGWGVTFTDKAHPNQNGANIAAENTAKSIVKLFGKQYFL